MEQEHQSFNEALSYSAPLEELTVVGIFDGMGGEQEGEAASYAAAVRLREIQDEIEPTEESVLNAYDAMQSAVCDVRASRRLSSIGTTAVTLVAKDGDAIVANLGDSSAYLLHKGDFTALTVAHNDAELLRELGIDRKAGLTQYLGMDDEDAPIEPHAVSLELATADRILLASDGLTDTVDKTDIAYAMATANNPVTLVSQLCAQALEAGGSDNITIIACEATSLTA